MTRKKETINDTHIYLNFIFYNASIAEYITLLRKEYNVPTELGIKGSEIKKK